MNEGTRVRLRRALAALALVAGAVPGGQAAAKPSFADLVANLKSPTAKTRQEAAAALGKSRRREAVAPLAALVRDSEPKVRLEVVRALRELRDLSAVPALVSSMQDGDAQIREEGLGALVEIYAERDRSDPIDRFLQAFSDEYDRASVPPYTNVDPSVYRALSAALRDEQRSIREDAAYAIGILDGRSEVRALVAALPDPEAKVRAAAATSGVIRPSARTSAKSRTRRNRRLAMRGVPRERRASSRAASGSSATPRIRADRRTISSMSASL